MAHAGNFATSIPTHEPPPLNDLSRIGQWVRAVDAVGETSLRQAEEGDYVTATGTVIARNCSEGDLTGSVNERIARALALAMTQAYRCEKTMGLTVAADVISILRRTRINCGSDIDQSTMASNEVVRGGNLFIAPLVGINSGYDQQYNINLSMRALSSVAWRRDVAFAADLFHEALHSTASSTSSWHEATQNRADRGCRNSIFEDRIYLISAACFPNSYWGFNFYWALDNAVAAVDCPGVCEHAFTARDSDLPHQLSQATHFTSLLGSVGPPALAHLYSQREAGLLCGRIRDTNTVRKVLKAERDSITARALPEGAERQPLGLRWIELRETAQSAYQAGANLSAIRAGLERSRAEIEELVQHDQPLMSEATRDIALIDGLMARERQYSTPSSNLPSLSRILDFFTL